MIGHHQVPAIHLQSISAVNVPVNFMDEPRIAVVKKNPNVANANHYLTAELMPCRYGHTKLQERYRKKHQGPENGVDDVQTEGQNTFDRTWQETQHLLSLKLD
jgi:hypothetical protein